MYIRYPLFITKVFSFITFRTENNVKNDFIDTEITVTGGVIGPTLSQSYEDGQNTTFSSTSDKISVASILRKPEVIRIVLPPFKNYYSI